jgi:hypothetical protein
MNERHKFRFNPTWPLWSTGGICTIFGAGLPIVDVAFMYFAAISGRKVGNVVVKCEHVSFYCHDCVRRENLDFGAAKPGFL